MADEVKRPERVQAAFEVWAANPDCGPNASAMFEYIESLEEELARFHSERSYIVGFNDGWSACEGDDELPSKPALRLVPN